jgi:hypothetical protein
VTSVTSAPKSRLKNAAKIQVCLGDRLNRPSGSAVGSVPLPRKSSNQRHRGSLRVGRLIPGGRHHPPSERFQALGGRTSAEWSRLYVIDGSAIPVNLGVNPALTITALAEHAMSHIAVKARLVENDRPHPGLGIG